jgi:4-amino-4-deoxy-L-arabinose transferase-like glycosyltransferase
VRSVATGWRDHLAGALLAAAYVAVLLGTSTDLAMSRDESFYVVAAERYGAWFRELAADAGAATQQPVIDRAWGYNHEHPALMKSLFALSWLAHERWDLFANDSVAHRFPGMLTAGLLLWLVYVFGARAYGRMAGAFAAGALALMPRFFYHAHLNAFDVPIVLMLTLVTYCYWRSLERPRWALATGLAFGLALATKHNSWILPGVLLIHFGWVAWGELRARRLGDAPRLSLVPWWLLAMLALGPPIFLGSWPWMWNDTWERIGGYVAFHVRHDYYNMAYFGRNYFEPPFPVSFPFVMTLYTVPLTTVALGLLGVATCARALLPPGLADRWWPEGRVSADAQHTQVLLLGCMLAPLVVIALPSTPIFGGTKHWMPAYPFLALFAGAAFIRAVHVLRGYVPPQVRARTPSHLVPILAAALLLAPAAVETAHSHPFGLSHYGFAAGGVPGAADDGMNRQFWGFTTGSVASWLAEQLPNGGSVWICDTTWQAWRMMQRDGMLPSNIRATGDMARADFALVHHEHHFAEVDFQAWVLMGSPRPAHVLTYDGVPIVSIYEHPRRRGASAQTPRK